MISEVDTAALQPSWTGSNTMSVSNERDERSKHHLVFLKDLITPGAYDVFLDYGL